MCGFCLSINDNGVNIRSLTESIRHRGPDSTKYYADGNVQCGFNRLAIVDSDARSDQPMVDRTGRYLLVFNGEIYNHNQLRDQLARRFGIRFETRSDTEVLLNGLIFEGGDFVPKLDGIFAFAFLDLLSLEVMLARDTFGVKPLYYFTQADRLYVSSEIRPLKKMAGNTLSIENLTRYLAYGAVANGGTIVSGVCELEPNTIKVFRAGRPVMTRLIHEFVYDVDNELSLDDLENELNSTIESQKPTIRFGVLFSGGLDSTLILSRCAKDLNFSGAYSVNVDHPDMSERQWQEYAIDVLGIGSKYNQVNLDRECFSLERLSRICESMDHPLFHPNYVGSYLLTRQASQDGLKVLLSGEGADELFLGYRWFFSDHVASDFLEYVPVQAMSRALGVPGVQPADTSGMSLLEVFQKIYLQRWLVRQDLTGMANSVEVRVPFLGLELAKRVNRLSFALKRGGGESKWIIKKFLSRQFSSEFVHRKKIGFDFPLNDWMGPEHLNFVRNEGGLIDAVALDEILASYQGSYMKSRIIFSLVSLSLWHRSLDKAPGSAGRSFAAQVF